MTKANINEAKARFSEYIDRVQGGESVVVCRHNTPIAVIQPLRAKPVGPRPIEIGRAHV